MLKSTSNFADLMNGDDSCSDEGNGVRAFGHRRVDDEVSSENDGD